MTELELYHYGVKGQKWGVRKNESITNKNKEKRHLGIDEKGRINLISGKTTTQAKKKFAVRTTIGVGATVLSIYVSKHPEIITKGSKFVKGMSNESVNDVVSDLGPKIFSNKLGRYLTENELTAKGFI